MQMKHLVALNLTACVILIYFSPISSAFTHTMHQVRDGTSHQFQFSAEECQAMADKFSTSQEKAHLIITIVNKFDHGGLGIALALRIAKSKVAWDLKRFSREFINANNGKPIAWVYQFRTRDKEWYVNLLEPLDKIAAIWRDATNTTIGKVAAEVNSALDTADEVEKFIWRTEKKPSILFKITYPSNDMLGWNYSVRGEGALPGGEIRVYIRTDRDYLQGTASIHKDGSWELRKTRPTKGTKNTIFAKAYDKNGNFISVSNEVHVSP
ncbi:MAG: hypothetical protein HY693_04840 [Deltaproteobacteria bacterium]|nr:hypothetical protein [Deltaproteobacteria bacterium]